MISAGGMVEKREEVWDLLLSSCLLPFCVAVCHFPLDALHFCDCSHRPPAGHLAEEGHLPKSGEQCGHSSGG